MSPLRKYINQNNLWNNNPIKLPTCRKDCDVLFDMLDSDLSPENLYCDGEISVAEGDRKYNFYMDVWEQLQVIGKTNREPEN